MASVATGMRAKKAPEGHIEVTRINDDLKELQDTLEQAVVDPEIHKIEAKKRHKAEKAERKANLKALKKAAKSNDGDKAESERKPRLYVLDFHGGSVRDLESSAANLHKSD